MNIFAFEFFFAFALFIWFIVECTGFFYLCCDINELENFLDFNQYSSHECKVND
jgi:hypothetical protein